MPREKSHDAGPERLPLLWTRQLYREYDNLVFWYRVRLRPPVIQISSSPSYWGRWEPFTRTISISERLIETYPWDIVIEILKHEMAHQMVTELFEGKSDHGPSFAEACRRLGVADWAARASGELPKAIPRWKDRALGIEEERLLRRVEKLLALASSPNEHEAALAMQRVQEIYLKYNLDRAALDSRTSAMVYTVINRKRKRISAPESMIFSILAEHFFVKVIYGRQFDAVDLCDYSMAELIGTHENVLMAEYVHGFLSAKIHSLWDDYRRRTGTTARRKSSYLLGVLYGFRDKLHRHKSEAIARAEKEKPSTSGRALVALSERQLEEFTRHRHPRLASRPGSTTQRDPSSFSAGKAEGEKIVLHKGLAHSEGNRGLLLKR